MKKVWKNYKQTIILLMALVIGAVVGLVFGENASVLSPLGDLFLNMMFVIIVPLIFLTITTSIAKIKQPKRVGKVLTNIFLVFIITSILACIVGLGATFATKLVNPNDSSAILESMDSSATEDVEMNILERTVSVISVDDFTGILSRQNIIALVLFSIMIGLAISKVGEKAKPLVDVLEACNLVALKFIDFAFYYAPIGLGCYFAALIGSFGASIAVGYVKTFIIYLIVSILYYFVVYGILSYIAGGKEGTKRFFKHIIPTTVTSISTCSSAACIPANIQSSKNIGVPDDIAETTIPLGCSFHKDGSIIGSVFKIMFLVYLFGTNIWSWQGILQVVATAFVANLLITAVPIGGGTISEMMILSLMGFPVASLPILTIIATIIDAPATMLNVVGDCCSSMLVARRVDGKDWIHAKDKKVNVVEAKALVKEEKENDTKAKSKKKTK